MNGHEALDYIGNGFGDYLGDTPFNDRDLDEALSVLRYIVDRLTEVEAELGRKGGTRPGLRVKVEQVEEIVDNLLGVYGNGGGIGALIDWLRSIGVEVDAGKEGK